MIDSDIIDYFEDRFDDPYLLYCYQCCDACEEMNCPYDMTNALIKRDDLNDN